MIIYFSLDLAQGPRDHLPTELSLDPEQGKEIASQTESRSIIQFFIQGLPLQQQK